PWNSPVRAVSQLDTNEARCGRGCLLTGSRGPGVRSAGHQAGSRHPVAWTALRMTRVTTWALVIRDRGPAVTTVMRAPARRAMNVWFATGITWSAVPITAQDGMVFQAGVPNVAPSALAASGRWVAAMTAARLAGRPLAKHPGTTLGLR